MSQQCHVSEVLQRYAPPVSSDQDGQISYTEFLGATLNLDEARGFGATPTFWGPLMGWESATLVKLGSFWVNSCEITSGNDCYIEKP